MSHRDDSDTSDGIDRRKAITRIGAATTAGVVGLAGMQFLTRPAFAIDSETFSASDVSVSTSDGQITAVWLRPDLTYSWSDLDANPDEITFAIAVEEPDNGGFVQRSTETHSQPPQTLSGSGKYTFGSAIEVTAGTSSWTASRFTADSGEGTDTTGPIGVRVTGTLSAGQSSYEDTKSDGFTVDVTNQAAQFGDGSTGTQSGGGVGGDAGVTVSTPTG